MSGSALKVPGEHGRHAGAPVMLRAKPGPHTRGLGTDVGREVGIDDVGNGVGVGSGVGRVLGTRVLAGEVGATLGTPVRARDGVRELLLRAEGCCDGWSVGTGDGLGVGSGEDGFGVGVADGRREAVGAVEGAMLGLGRGTVDGCMVAVGVGDGSGVGTGVCDP